jgi:hypothetical protein
VRHLGFSLCFPEVALVTKNGLSSLFIYKSTIDGQKHNSTMVLDASLGAATPKMNKSFVHMALVSADRACAQAGYLKCSHPIIIDGDMRWDSGWFLVGFGVGGHRTCD